MSNTKIKEKIDNYKDQRKNLWATFVVLTGGLVALTLNFNSPIKAFWFVLGIISDATLIYSIIRFNIDIETFINQIDEGK